MRSAIGSTFDRSDASPLPSQSVPSGAERTVPIVCESMSEGMQSTVFDGAGQGPETRVPRIGVSGPTVLSVPSVKRLTRPTLGSDPSGKSGLTSYV